MAKKSEINKKDLINLIEITDEEFARITDNLYSQKIDYKSLPNLVLLPTVKEELRKELNIKGNLYITKNRLLHTNPVRKNAHKNQGFTKEEYSSIPETIRNATYVLKETESEYNSFLITALDKNDSCKVNCIIFDEDKNGNLLTTIKKIPLLSLRSRIYKIVGTGVEPAISNALCEPSTTLTTSPDNENNTTKDEFVNNLAVDTTIINQDSSKSNNSEKIAPQEIAERAQFVQNKLSEAGIDVVSDKNEFDTIISKEADGKIFKLQPITEYGKNDFYRKIAGEVEARNVQNRMNMTPEERLNTPLSETEDVAQEDQIVTFDGTVAASKITSRSQYLEGKTSLTDEDIISLLDLPPEKESRKVLKSYTDKNYSDFENDEASLQRLTENLINNSDYLLYRGSYIAKSKLLYEQSVTLCNEIPSLVIGQEIKESFYLLPYGYAKDSKQNFKQFADILDKTVFTDIKRIYGESLRNNFKKAHKQGKNVFFFICNDKLDSKECENEIKKCVYNRKEIKDKSSKYYFYIEKSKQCLIFDFDSKGKLLKKKKLNIDLKKIKLSTNEELKVVRGRMQSIPSGTLKNLSDNKESVNTFFNSLLLRGEVEMIRRHKELQKYDSKCLNCLEALKQITNQTQSELLQNSNRLFIQSEIESEFYKDLIKEKKRNVALIDKTQGDKSMPSEKKELNISEEEAVRIQLAREIRQNMPNLSDGERAAALAILEAGAASMKMTLRDYVQTTFPHGVFGDFDKAQNAAQQQGVEINGAVSVSGFGANARAVIYASKTADFSTWCHELSHIWQVQLTGELKVNAEKVFQVQNGNWQESTYTFADGHTDTSAEAFAYGFEDFLKHKAGEMAAEDKKAIFEKFADYMSRTYNGVKENIKVNEDIAKVYEQFVQLDDNILAEAEKAVRMEKDLYDSKKNINALLNSPDLRSSKKVSKTLGYVSPQFSRLAKQYGYDIEGFRHTIDNFFINHANNRHSTARTETARGNVAITNDDILNIAKVYESPDYIIFGTKTKTGNPAIVYAKNMGNATVFVEDVRSGKKELAAETLYKKSGAIDVSSKKEAPELYAHSDPESISIVDVKKEFVNHIANGELIFQAAYHGSGASFDHFDTEHYGLSGEGSMSFGWGTYLTESEAIARDYADRQNGIGKKLDSLLKKYPDLYSHITPIYNHMSLGDSFEEAKKNYVGYLRENHIPGIRKITKSIEELKAEDFAELFKKDRNLYTVSIPDGKYLSWNNDVPEATKTEIAEKLHSHLVESDPESYSGNAANYLRQELESLFESEMDGQRFYGSLADYLGSERQASEFLKESGYTGISYPAGTIYGNGNGATNYVIFNDDDIEIKEHLQFQTRTTEQKERKKIEVQTYKFQNGETIDEILSKQTSWATDEEFLDNMIDNSLREVADFADEKENELLKKISIAKNNPEVDLKLLAVQTDAAARYMAAKHYDYRLADVGNRPFSKDFINPYAQDDFPYELPSWIKNHLEEYPNQNEPEHTSEEEKAYQEWEESLDDNQSEENDSNGQQSKFDSELSDYIAGKLPKNHIFDLGFPGEILQNCGFPKEQRIELSGSHLEFKSKLKRHPFDLGEIKGLDVALQNPLAVFAYGDKTKSQNIIVNIEKEGKNFLTGIHFNQKNRGYEVSDIRTLYPKENIEWLNWINQGKLIYGNKEKLQALIAQQRMNVAEVNSQVVQSPLHEHCLESVKNILQKFGDVKEIYTDGHLFYEEIREQSKIEQKFFAYYTEKGNIDARELSSLEAEEFYNALKHNDITKIDEYKNNDFHEISELADEIYLEHFKNSVSTEEKYVIESLSEIGNAIKNDSAIILKSPTFGDVTFSKGVFGDLSKKNNGGYGINHIVEGRYVKDNLSKQDIASLLYLIKNTVETTEVDKDDSKSRQNIIKDGIWVTIRKDFDGIKQNWVVTGFAENDGNGQITKEAADAIKAVNAQYGYAPEHLFVSEQVGAVIASVNTIAQNILKSNDIERIKNFKSVYANTEFLSENEKGLFIDNQSQLMSRGKQEKSLDSETTIPQKREINNVVNKIKMPEQLIFASTEIGQMVERLTGKQLGTVNPTRENEIFAPPVTTIPQNTENSINYHGLTLTNMAAKHYDDYFAEYAPKEDLLNVINFSNWTYFNSEKISTKVYDVEISASLYEQLLPSEYKERSIKEDEVVCIQYRKSVLSEEQDQFLIEKFDKNNFMLLQQKEIQIDVELKNKIKSICNSYIEPQNNNSYTDEILDKINANSFTKEATDTIQTVIARNSYALEHSSIREQVGAVVKSIALDNEKSTIKNNNEKSQERHSDAKDYLIQTTRLFLSKLKEKNLPFLKGKEQGSIIIIKPQVVRDAATGKAFTGYTQLMAQALIQALYDQKKLPELEYDLITYDQAKACGTFIKKGSPHITLTNYNRTTNSASKQMYYFKSGCNSPEMIELHKESIARNRAIKRIRLSLEEKEIPSERQTEEKNKITLLHYEEMTYLKALNKDTEQYFDSLLAEEKNMLTELCKKTPLTQKTVKELAETLRKDRLISTQLSLQKNSERYFDATECIVPEDFIAKAMAAASLGCSLETTEKTIDSITKDLHQTLSKNIDHYDYGKAFEVGEVITEKCIKNCKEMKNQEYEAAELAKKLEQKQQELKKNPINLLMELLNKNDLSNRTIGGYER